jgi:hypothetical protein
VLGLLAQNCAQLTHLTLKGPFLCTNHGFATLFEALGNLEQLELESASRLDHTGLSVLSRTCPKLTRVRLCGCENVNDDAVQCLVGLPRLAALELVRIDPNVSASTLIALVEAVGCQLAVLSLSG